VRGDISSSANGWKLDRFEFRAPGMTQVRLSGRLDVGADGVAFTGPAEIDASDPKVLAAWLEGRSETTQGELRPMSLRGDVTLASDRIAVEGLKAEIDRRPLTGRLAYLFRSGTRPARLDAEIKAPQFDIDAAVAFGKALLAGSAMERPGEISLSADIERATFAGIEARDARVRLKVDASGLQLDRLSIGDFAGSRFTASGRVETNGHAPRGTLSLDLETKQTAAILATAGQFAPKSAEQFAVTGDLDDLHVDARVNVKGDWSKQSVANVRLDGTVDAPQGRALIKFMNLDWLVAVGNGAGQLKVQAAGPLTSDMTFDARLSADGLSAQAGGSGRLFEGEGVRATATLRVTSADLRPILTGPA